MQLVRSNQSYSLLNSGAMIWWYSPAVSCGVVVVLHYNNNNMICLSCFICFSCSQTATANTSCCSDSTGASAEDTLDCSTSSVLMLFLSYCFNSVLDVITKAGWIVHHKSTPHQKCHFSKQYITLINSCITTYICIKMRRNASTLKIFT